MLPRCWVESPLSPGLMELGDGEAHHLRHVLRLTAGAEVEVFDGRGASAPATLSLADKRRVVVEVRDVVVAAPRRTRIVLATAVPKGERLDWLVEKATELGVTELVPLRTRRSTVDPRDSKLDRLRQLVVAACKQSRRNDLMEIRPVRDYADFLPTLPRDHCHLIARPDGRPLPEVLPGVARGGCAVAGWVGLIGPEGGWTEEELRMAEEAGALPISLGEQILRIETAAIALSAALQLAMPQ